MSDIQISRILTVAANAVSKEIAAEDAMQVESDQGLEEYFDQGIPNRLEQAKNFKDIKHIHARKAEDPDQADEAESKIVDVEKTDEASERFQKNNYELNAKTLRILRSKLAPSDSSTDILQKVEEVYGEAALADEALDFLMETTDGQLLAATAEAKEKLNKDKGKEIRAGKNMGAQAREFAEQGLGSPSSLRDLYRDITLNPRDPLKLFDELTEKFRYPKLKSAITFILHALGSDLKAKGPSIQRAELKRLLDETRSMQGILGIFRFFQSRMKMIEREFKSYDLIVPPKLTFELIARLFAKILGERFMNGEKILQTSQFLGVAEETAGKIILFSQMRDALKQIAPKYFRDPKHREDLLKIFTETLDKLEDQLEEEEEEE